MVFADRRDAGRRLGDALRARAFEDVTVLGLARGGVAVAREVARALGRPLDVVVVRKIGAPGNEEFAVGAVGEDGQARLDRAAIALMGVPAAYLEEAIERARDLIRRRAALYRVGAPPDLLGRTAVIVDDGIATGHTMEAAIETVRRWGAARVVIAVPVAARETMARLRPTVDDCVVLHEPEQFLAVGQFYESFAQVLDEEVRHALEEASGTDRGTEAHAL